MGRNVLTGPTFAKGGVDVIDTILGKARTFAGTTVRDDPRLERDHTVSAETFDISRPNSWLAMSTRRKK